VTSALRVSVVIPVYDAGRFLTEALHSVFAQGDAVGEVIVVDDGSTKPIEPALGSFRTRIRCVAHENRGPAAARNTGIALARETCVAFLDADDTWPAEVLPRALSILARDAAVQGVHGLTQLYLPRADAGSQGPPLWTTFGGPWRSPQLGSIVVRRELFARVSGFDESLRRGEDFDWVVRLRKLAVPLRVSDDVALLYRIHERNRSRETDPISNNTFAVLRRALERQRCEHGRRGSC